MATAIGGDDVLNRLRPNTQMMPMHRKKGQNLLVMRTSKAISGALIVNQSCHAKKLLDFRIP